MILEPFATGYLSVEGAPCTRIAQGLLYAARELPIPDLQLETVR